jgi:fatty-acyl-CoA synthase/long-chain acyl-CoA synthetase
VGLDYLALQAASRPDQPAVIGTDRTLTYSGLNARANRVAHALGAIGAQPGDRVATMSFNSVAGHEIGAGSRKRGLVGVPVNFRLRGPEVAHVLNDSGAAVVVADAAHVPVVEEARLQIEGERTYIALAGAAPAPAGWLDYEELLAAAGEEEASDENSNPLGASMIYTSGTTGHPKGAYRPQGASPEIIAQTVQVFGLSDSDVHLVAGPGYHSAVAYFSALTLLLGGTVVVMARFDPEEAMRLSELHRVSTTFMAPTLLRRICDLPEEVRGRYDVSSMRAIIMGAAPCPIELKERVLGLFGETLWEFYGATETGVNTVLSPSDQLRKPGSCGKLVPGHEIRLLDEQDREVPINTPGQLWVRNPHLAEYYKNPAATERSMRDGFFTVGDVAYQDAEGYYYICDRRVDMIISGGVNIYPAEIEAALHAHPAVADVAVIGVPDPEWGEAVKAVVELHPGADAGEAELIAFCSQHLADYKKPRSVDFLGSLPRDPAGKLLKRQIREPYWEGAGRRI